MNKISASFSNFFSALASLMKVTLLSRPVKSHAIAGNDRTLVIMGNGPSLREAIDNHSSSLLSNDLMAVNFAANTPDFFHLRPQYYVLADDHFFKAIDTDKNVKKLWENISRADWDMVLFVPARRIHLVKPLVSSHITLATFNLTPVEGSDFICHPIYDLGLGMPRPRNVLIPSIMTAISIGYKKIIIVGADHTWSQSLWVDDKNRVISVQPHFYKDNEKELDRVADEYAGYHLHHILKSLYIAFKSYHDIARYANRKKVEILNATPGSFIDAFERTTLS